MEGSGAPGRRLRIPLAGWEPIRKLGVAKAYACAVLLLRGGACPELGVGGVA